MPTGTFEYRTDAERKAIERAIAFVAEMHDLARTAPAAQVLDQCEQQATDRGLLGMVRSGSDRSWNSSPCAIPSSGISTGRCPPHNAYFQWHTREHGRDPGCRRGRHWLCRGLRAACRRRAGRVRGREPGQGRSRALRRRSRGRPPAIARRVRSLRGLAACPRRAGSPLHQVRRATVPHPEWVRHTAGRVRARVRGDRVVRVGVRAGPSAHAHHQTR